MEYSKLTDPLVAQNPEHAGLKSLSGTVWVLLVLQFFIELPFALTISGSTIYNIDVQHFTEIQAGVIFALIGLAVGCSAIGFSNFPTKFGVRVSLLYGNALGLLTNVLVYCFEDRYLQVFIVFILFIPCISLNFISLKLGIKHLTSGRSRSFAYSLSYTVFFSVSGLSAAFTDLMISTFGVTRQTFDYIFIVNIVSFIIAFAITYQLKTISDSESDLEDQGAWTHITEVLTSKHFWKYFSLIGLLSVVKSMFFHLNATLPIYMNREIGPGAHFGYVLAAHQLVLVVSTPLLTILTKYTTPYTLLVIGSLITSMSVLMFIWKASYLTISIFTIIISFGEAIYAPRLIDYTLHVAPKGKEAIYLGISNVPNFLSLLITGITSGILISMLCPSGDTQRCSEIWFWIGGYSFASCLPLLFLYRFYNA